MLRSCKSSFRVVLCRQVIRARDPFKPASNIMDVRLPGKSVNSESYPASNRCQQFGLCTIRTILDDFDVFLDCNETKQHACLPTRELKRLGDGEFEAILVRGLPIHARNPYGPVSFLPVRDFQHRSGIPEISAAAGSELPGI